MAPRIRRKKCSYINCENDSKNQPDLKYFHFPRSNCHDWIIASGNETLSTISETNICQHYYVCSEHFQMTDYKRILPSFETKVLLKNGVVPLPYNHRSLSVQGDGQPEMEEKKDSKSFKVPQKRKKKCAFVNCGNNSENHPEIKFYRFPHSNYKEWIEASGCHKLNTLTKINILSNYYVCSNHFRLTDCKKILPPSKKHFPLKSGVVPLFFRDENSGMKAEKSDSRSFPEKVRLSQSASKKAKTPQSASKKAKTPCPASKKFKASQPSTCETPSLCLPGSSPTSQTVAESTSQTSQSRTHINSQNSSHQHGDDSSTNDLAGVLVRENKRKVSEESLLDLRPDQTQGTALCPIQEPNNNQNCLHSLQCSAPNEPMLTPLLSEVGDEKSCSKGDASSDDEVNEFFGGDEVYFESFEDEEENQTYNDDYKSHGKTDGSAIERRTDSCSELGSEAESSSKEKVQMHQGSELEPDDQEVVSESSTNESDKKYSPVTNPSLCNKGGTYSSPSTQVVEDRSVNSKDSAVGGSILSSTSSGGTAGEGGSEKLDVIVTAGAKAGMPTSSVVSTSTPIITAGKGCTTVAKINTESSFLSASPTATEAQLFFRLPTGQTIPVKVPVAALMSASTMPSPSPLCLPPPVQQVVELPQQGTSKQSVADLSPASDPLTGHQPGPSPAASGSDAPEGPTSSCSSKPQKRKKRKKCVVASPSKDDEEAKKIKALERKRAAAARCRQKKSERVLGIVPQIAELATVNAKLESEVASLKAEMTSLKDLLLQHMACPAPLAPTVRGANPVVGAAANPVVGANPFVVAAANPVVAAAAKPVVGANPFVVAAANPVVVAAEGPKVAAVPWPGQSSDAERLLKPRGRIILPSTSKPAPTTFLLLTMQRKAAT